MSTCKGVGVCILGFDDTCSGCKRSTEDVLHAIVYFPRDQMVFNSLGSGAKNDSGLKHCSFADLSCAIRHEVLGDVSCRVVVVCWGVWKGRN